MQYSISPLTTIGGSAKASADELARGLALFRKAMTERPAMLETEVRRAPQYATWSADMTPQSLDSLGRWLVDHIETGPRSDEELRAIKSSLAFPVDVEARTLTEKAYSLGADAGLYLGLVLAKLHPRLSWSQLTKDRRHIDYGQVVLTGFNGLHMNPLRIGIVLAHGIASGRKGEGELRRLYDTWESNLS